MLLTVYNISKINYPHPHLLYSTFVLRLALSALKRDRLVGSLNFDENDRMTCLKLRWVTNVLPEDQVGDGTIHFKIRWLTVSPGSSSGG